jgi:uncharacterized protein YndB with AHSA1/START domain
MQKDIHQTWFFQQHPSEVWEYLTKPELIEQWLTKNDFQPVVGHKFQFISSPTADGDQPNHAYCQVLEIIPLNRLSYSWRKGPKEEEITVDSVVTWTLTGKDGGTELQLQHAGFLLLEDSVAHDNGWNYCLNRMTELINSPSHADANP